VIEHAQAQVAQELLSESRHQQDLGARKDEREDGDDQVADGGPVDGAAVALAHAVVDAVPHECGTGQDGRGRAEHHRECGHDLPLVGPQHGEGAPDDVAGLLASELVLLGDGRAAHPRHGYAASRSAAWASTWR
jgi:hypothetical protein